MHTLHDNGQQSGGEVGLSQSLRQQRAAAACSDSNQEATALAVAGILTDNLAEVQDQLTYNAMTSELRAEKAEESMASMLAQLVTLQARLDRNDRSREASTSAPSQAPVAAPQTYRGGNLQLKLPAFTAAEGINLNAKYCREVEIYLNSNLHIFETNPQLQINLLRATFTGHAAETFWSEVLPDLHYLTPSARLLLGSMTPGTSYLSKLSSMMEADGGEDVSQTPTAAMYQQRINSDPTAALRKVQAAVRKSNGFNSLDPLQAILQRDDTPDQRWGLHRAKHFLASWILVVEHYLNKPANGELQLWNTGLKMGVPNDLTLDVPKNEGPENFSRRITNMERTFNAHWPELFQAVAKGRSCYDVWLAGIPHRYSEAAEQLLQGINPLTNGLTRLGMASVHCDNMFATDTATQSTDANKKETARRADPADQRDTRPAARGSAQPAAQPAAQQQPAQQQRTDAARILKQPDPNSRSSRDKFFKFNRADQAAHQARYPGTPPPQYGATAMAFASQCGVNASHFDGVNPKRPPRANQQPTQQQPAQQPRAAQQQQPQQQPAPVNHTAASRANAATSRCQFCHAPPHPGGTQNCPVFTAFKQQHAGQGSAHANSTSITLPQPESRPASYSMADLADGEEDFQDCIDHSPCVGGCATVAHNYSADERLPSATSSATGGGGNGAGYEASDAEWDSLLFSLLSRIDRASAYYPDIAAMASYKTARRYPKTWAPDRVWSGMPQEDKNRPSSFVPVDTEGPPTLAEYLATLNRYNKLRYLRQCSKSPDQCCTIMVNGKAHIVPLAMLDDAANCNLMNDNQRKALGIELLPTDITLTTSNGSSTPVLGITPPLLVVYGAGSPNPIRVWHYFLVTKDMGHVYGILLGNLDTQRFGGIINAPDSTLTLHPEYERLGAQSPKLVLPTVLQSAGNLPHRKEGLGR